MVLRPPFPVVRHALLALAVAGPAVAGAQTFTVTRTALGGDGGTDYLTADPATGRVFVSRGTPVSRPSAPRLTSLQEASYAS